MRLENEVYKILKNSIEIDYDEKWIIGFSGGPDSVFLLHMLMNIPEIREKRINLILAHVNHLLRGENSDGDEEFVKQTGKNLNLKVHIKRANIIEISKKEKISLEEAGREVRYNFFNELKKLEGASKIFLAHNKDDQIETFLFRMMRGSSLEGLTGIDSNKGDYIRPICEIYKNQIVEYLDRNKIDYRIDESNLESDYTRNSIRLELIPFIESRYNPKFKEKIFNLIKDIREVNSQLSVELEEFTENGKLVLEKLKSESQWMKKKIINNFITRNGFNCDRYKLNKITELLDSGGTKKISLEGETFLVKDYHYIYIQKNIQNPEEKKNEILLNIPGKVTFNDFEIEAVIRDLPQKKNFCENTILTNFKKNDTLIIRCRKHGDKMIPAGMKSEKKLKEIFINEKVPKEERDSLPVFLFKEEIFWIPGIKYSERYLKKEINRQWTELIVRRIKNC